MDYRVISIGALSQHELWPIQGEQRTPHATTTLIRSGDRVILVDPGLPDPIISARLMERSGLAPEAITDVFLTNFRPAHRRGLMSFPKARWLIGETEREFIGLHLVDRFKREQDASVREILNQDIAILKRCVNAPDRLAPQVDLFPLPGYTPGTCGLILTPMSQTIVVAGEAVATVEHHHRARPRVLRGASSIRKRPAKASLKSLRLRRLNHRRAR